MGGKTHRVMEEVKNGKKKGEMKRQSWSLRPDSKPYIVARYFCQRAGRVGCPPKRTRCRRRQSHRITEEHGGEEGALKDVSTKGDAQEAYTPSPGRCVE